ncbi:MAG: hypothetical protein FWG14_10500 [Peptococcaceae bacterium]|nr:hypothetical protein [Peptococcaceae bacterium]
MDKAMKENIFKQMSETSQESQLVSINASGQKNYDWQSIEDLLRRGSDNIPSASDLIIPLIKPETPSL